MMHKIKMFIQEGEKGSSLEVIEKNKLSELLTMTISMPTIMNKSILP